MQQLDNTLYQQQNNMSESPSQVSHSQQHITQQKLLDQNINDNIPPANQMPPPPLPPPPGSSQPSNQQEYILSSQNHSNPSNIPYSNYYQQQQGSNQPNSQTPLSNQISSSNQINTNNYQNQTQLQQQQQQYRLCAFCNLAIRDRYLLQCLDRFWHVHCLKCQMCKVTLSELSEKCFTRDNMILCRDDYIKMFGGHCVGGMCETCQQNILGNEHVMRAFNSVYHVDCFACSHCRIRLKTGDKYCYVNGRIYCEKDNPQQQQHISAGGHTMPMQQLSQNGPQSQQQLAATTPNKKGSGAKRSKNSTSKASVPSTVVQQQQHQIHTQQQHQIHHHQHMNLQQQLLFNDQEQILQQQQLI